MMPSPTMMAPGMPQMMAPGGFATTKVCRHDDCADERCRRMEAHDALLHAADNVPAMPLGANKLVGAALRTAIRPVGAVGLAGGQVMDLECEAKQGVTLDELTWIHTHKTAKLLEVSVATGALLGGANGRDVKQCETFANDIGIAFQVADDILDVTATSEELGKTAGKDEDTDKTTYPKLMGLDGARAEAERLYQEAIDSVVPYGDAAVPLIAIAKYIVERNN